MSTIRIATRKSPLAIWQAEHVAKRLRREHGDLAVELVAMSTQGDKLLDAPLAKVGGKGLFVKELENALLDGRADIAVHSMKDVPVDLPDGLHLPVILARGNPHDAFVSSRYAMFSELPRGARMGTSSLRRKSQLMVLRPDVELIDLRGGVQTRLSKLDAGEFDAIVLACAGLERLELGDRVRELLSPETMLPAIGQGALGIECRENDERVHALITPLHDRDTAVCVTCERAMNRRLGGGCQVPIAGFAELAGGLLRLRGLVARLDGSEILHERGEAAPVDAETLGREVATRLLGRGADKILEEVYAGA